MELTREYFEEYLDKKFDEKLANYPTKEEFFKALEPLATKQDVQDAIEELARYVAETIANPAEERFQQAEAQFRQIDMRFERIDEHFQEVDSRFDGIERHFEQIDVRLDKMDSRQDKMDSRQDKMDEKFDQLGLQLENMDHCLRHVDQVVEELRSGNNWQPRVVKLEDDMGKIRKALYLSD